jgi:ABC-type phosphate transport system substrate-binding protein
MVGARRSLLAVALVSAFLLVAAPAMAINPNGSVDVIKGGGSDTTYDVMQRLDTLWNNSVGCNTFSPLPPAPINGRCNPQGPPFGLENHDHDVVYEYNPLGSSNGITQLTQFGTTGVTKLDFARSSRGPKVGDSVNLNFIAFAREAIPWLNFRTEAGSPASGAANLTQQQLRDIFHNCTITNWSSVGGSSASIITWAAPDGSGTRKDFDAFLGSGLSSDTCIPAQYKDGSLTNGERKIVENDPTPIRNCTTYAGGSCAAGDDLKSIFYMSSAAWYSWPATDPLGAGAGADLGSIDGIAPSQANIATIGSGGYPYSRNVHFVYRKRFTSNNVTPAAERYVDPLEGWICKSNNADPSADTTHTTNPRTGNKYGLDINKTINEASGFALLSFGPIGGSFVGSSKCRDIPVPV